MYKQFSKVGNWWTEKDFDQKNKFLNNMMIITFLLLLFTLSMLTNPVIQAIMLLIVIANLAVMAFSAWKEHKIKNEELLALSRELKAKESSTLAVQYSKKEKTQKELDDEIIKIMESQFEVSKKDED